MRNERKPIAPVPGLPGLELSRAKWEAQLKAADVSPRVNAIRRHFGIQVSK